MRWVISMIALAAMLALSAKAADSFKEGEVAFVRQLEVVTEGKSLSDEQKKDIATRSGFNLDFACSVRKQQKTATERILDMGYVAKVRVNVDRVETGVAVRIVVSPK